MKHNMHPTRGENMNHTPASYQHCGLQREGQRELEPWLDEMRSDPYWAESKPSLDAAMFDIYG